MAFGEMPRTLAESELHVADFSFDNDKGIFTVGGEDFALDTPELERRLFTVKIPSLKLDELPQTPIALVGRSSLNVLVTTPMLHTWVELHRGNQLVEGTVDAMRVAYGAISAKDVGNEPVDAGSIFGFTVRFPRPGQIDLQTMGNLATLGPNPNGRYINSGAWPTGYTELVFHNDDLPAERVSLMAGLGHLAARCAAEST